MAHHCEALRKQVETRQQFNGLSEGAPKDNASMLGFGHDPGKALQAMRETGPFLFRTRCAMYMNRG